MTCQLNVLDDGRPNTGRTMGHLGPFEPFCPPKPCFGLMWTKTVIRPYLGLRGSNLNSEGTFFQVQTPTFCGFHLLSCLVLSCLGPRSTNALHVLAYTLSNAHVGHLKMSEDFCRRKGNPIFDISAVKYGGEDARNNTTYYLLRVCLNCTMPKNMWFWCGAQHAHTPAPNMPAPVSLAT